MPDEIAQSEDDQMIIAGTAETESIKPVLNAPEGHDAGTLDADTGIPVIEVSKPEIEAPSFPIILGNAEAFVKKFELGLVNDIKEAVDHIKAFLSHHGA